MAASIQVPLQHWNETQDPAMPALAYSAHAQHSKHRSGPTLDDFPLPGTKGATTTLTSFNVTKRDQGVVSPAQSSVTAFTEDDLQIHALGSPTQFSEDSSNLKNSFSRANAPSPFPLPQSQQLYHPHHYRDDSLPMRDFRGPHSPRESSMSDQISLDARERIHRDSVVIAEIKTNVIIRDEYVFLTNLSNHLSQRFQRPASSIFVTLDHSACLLFAGSFDSAYVVNITTLASQIQPSSNKRNAALIQSFLASSLGVLPDRGIIKFHGMKDECLATAGTTITGQVERLQRAWCYGSTDTKMGIPSSAPATTTSNPQLISPTANMTCPLASAPLPSTNSHTLDFSLQADQFHNTRADSTTPPARPFPLLTSASNPPSVPTERYIVDSSTQQNQQNMFDHNKVPDLHVLPLAYPRRPSLSSSSNYSLPTSRAPSSNGHPTTAGTKESTASATSDTTSKPSSINSSPLRGRRNTARKPPALTLIPPRSQSTPGNNRIAPNHVPIPPSHQHQSRDQQNHPIPPPPPPPANALTNTSQTSPPAVPALPPAGYTLQDRQAEKVQRLGRRKSFLGNMFSRS